MIQAAIFDLDGTLMDTEILWVEATQRFVNAQGYALSRAEALGIVYGRSWRDVYRDIAARYPAIDLSIEAMEEVLREHMHALRAGRDIVIPGSVALLKRLAATLPVCIVSGSPRADIENAIDLMGIRADLAFAIAAEDYGPGKPDPACFMQAAARLGVAPADCVVFEDARAGVQAAKAAGMYCVALVREGLPAQDVSAADATVADLAHFTLPAGL